MTEEEKAIQNIKDILEENAFLRDIVQSCLNYGRIYHHQKKRLKNKGFNI